MLRHLMMVSAVLSLAALGAGYAWGTGLIDLSAMAPLNYYNAIPDGINPSGVVTMQGYSSTFHSAGAYYHTYLYTGGTAGTLADITSKFTSITTACPMNASGQMAVLGLGGGVGYSYTGGTSGSVTTYKYSTYATDSLAIDSAGEEAGYWINSGNNNRWTPMVYTGGTAYGLNLPTGDGYTSDGAGIDALNGNGQAVGFTTPGNPPGIQAAVWTYTISGGTVTSQTATDIKSAIVAQYPSAISSDLLAINSSGNAVGSWSSTGYGSSLNLSSVTGSFIYNVGTPGFTSLGSLLVGSPEAGTLNYEAGLSQAINDSGIVVGCIANTSNPSGYDAAIWQSGTVTDLNTIYGPSGLNILNGFVLDNATAIDNNGDIAGYGHDSGGHNVQAWVIYAAVPEPGTVGLIGTGLVGLLLFAWRKRR